LAGLFSPGQQGVHRWIDIGPVHMNVAMMVLPAAVVALATFVRDRSWPWIPATVSLGLLVIQPDLSQAASLAAAIGLIAAFAARSPLLRLVICLAAVAAAGAAWFRPFPLQPVPEVEGLIGLAFGVSPLLAGIAVSLLGAVAAAPALATALSPKARLAGGALGVLFVLWAATPLLGAFPIPFVGIGMSPIVGGWIGIGLLAGWLRNSTVTEVGETLGQRSD
jgi:hypothetical protein